MPVTRTTSSRRRASWASTRHRLPRSGPASPAHAPAPDSRSPPSMRAISATRASPATAARRCRVGCRAAPSRPRSAHRRRPPPAPGASRPAPGACGPAASSAGPRCRRRRRRRRRRSRRRSASAPPPPARCAVVTAMASARRDSSPPEATLASGRGVVPAWPATQELHRLQPVRLRLGLRQQGDLEAPAAHAQLLHRLRDGGGELRRGGLAQRRDLRSPGLARRRSASGAARFERVRGRPRRRARAARRASLAAAPAARPAGGGSGAPAAATPTSRASSSARRSGSGSLWPR